MGYKLSVLKQAKFDYSPLGNIFTKGLDKDDQKDGLFKGLWNIKDKNQEMLSIFSAASKVSKAAKIQSDYNYDFKNFFYKFYWDFKYFKRMSLGSKYDEINEFYALLNPFINTYDTTKKELWKISNNFTINALILTKIFTIVKR